MTEIDDPISPLAMVQGEPITELPQDLYIPPDALEIILESFEGPLDFLLYLIRKQNINILDIPVAEITRQYMKYIDVLTALRFELAAEYLVMAATLAEIKSRLLLPTLNVVEEERDPRADLMRKLQEYEQIKNAAFWLDDQPQQQRDTFICRVKPPLMKIVRPLPILELPELVAAYEDVVEREALFKKHAVRTELLSVRERMVMILTRLGPNYTPFANFAIKKEGRMGVVVTFLAVLELLKQSMLDAQQDQPYSPLLIRTIQS